jgi:hypothetical protein
VAHVDAPTRDRLDDLVVVRLEVLYVLVRNAVLDEVVVVLQVELFPRPPRQVVQLKDVGALLLLGVGLEDPFLLVLGEQLGSVLVEPALVVVEDVQGLHHFGLVVDVVDDDRQTKRLPGVVPTHLVVVHPAVHLLQLDADRQRQLLEVELPTIVLTKDIVFYLFLNVPLRSVPLHLVQHQVEDKMHDPIANLLAEVELHLLHFIEEGPCIFFVEDGVEQFHLLPDGFPLFAGNALHII